MRILAILGIFFTILGWLLKYYKEIPFIKRIFSPKYIEALAGLKKLYRDNNIIDSDRGFNEISKIISKKYLIITDKDKAKKMRIAITSIEMLQSAVAVNVETGETSDKPKLRITLSNNQLIEGNAASLKSEIEKKYLSKPIFRISGIIFWSGIVLSLINLFKEDIIRLLNRLFS